MRIPLIPKESVVEIWPQIEEWVKNAIGADRSYLPEDIKAACITSSLELRLIYTDKLRGFLTYKIGNSPQGKVCYAPWLGGEDLGEWVKPAFELFSQYLKSQGCIQYSFIGRKAWGRLIDANYEGIFYLINL